MRDGWCAYLSFQKNWTNKQKLIEFMETFNLQKLIQSLVSKRTLKVKPTLTRIVLGWVTLQKVAQGPSSLSQMILAIERIRCVEREIDKNHHPMDDFGFYFYSDIFIFQYYKLIEFLHVCALAAFKVKALISDFSSDCHKVVNKPKKFV